MTATRAMSLSTSKPANNQGVSADHMFDRFQEDILGICGEFYLRRAEGGTRFSGTISKRKSGGFGFAQIGHNSFGVQRRPKDIRRDSLDQFVLIEQKSGISCVVHNGTETNLVTGDLYLLDAARPCDIQNGGKSAQHSVLHLPRESMTQRFGPMLAGGLKIAATDSTGLAMRSILRKIEKADDPDYSPFGDAFYSLFGAHLAERRTQAPTGLNLDQALVSQAMGIIRQHYRDRKLATKKIAELIGTSPRRLQTAFATYGESPHATLQKFRLEAAHSMLMASEMNGHTIAQIAFANGYSDLSTFHRHFKARFNLSPKAAMNQSLRDLQ